MKTLNVSEQVETSLLSLTPKSPHLLKKFHHNYKKKSFYSYPFKKLLVQSKEMKSKHISPFHMEKELKIPDPYANVPGTTKLYDMGQPCCVDA